MTETAPEAPDIDSELPAAGELPAESQELAPLPPSFEEAAPTLDQVAQVMRWVIEGKSADDIQQSIGEHWPAINQHELTAQVVKRLQDAGEFDPTLVRGMCLEATREIYSRALDTADLPTALRAIRQLWEMASARN